MLDRSFNFRPHHSLQSSETQKKLITMADSETPVSTTAADADAATATATAASTTTETKPPVTQPTRWGDIEDDAPEEPNPESSSTSELNLETLKIDETKKINKFLDEPEDSNIKAVSLSSLNFEKSGFRVFLFWGAEILIPLTFDLGI